MARHHDGLAVVDLDETLYLRNSTEHFVALAAPGFAPALVLRLLDTVAPRRWFGEATAAAIEAAE